MRDDNRGPQQSEPDYRGGISLTWLARKLENFFGRVRVSAEERERRKRIERDWRVES